MKNSWRLAVGLAALGTLAIGTACKSASTPQTLPEKDKPAPVIQPFTGDAAGRFAGSFKQAATDQIAKQGSEQAALEAERNIRQAYQQRYDDLNSALREKMTPIATVFDLLHAVFPAREIVPNGVLAPEKHYYSIYTRDGSCAWFVMGADPMDGPFFQKDQANPAVTFYLEDDRKPKEQRQDNSDMRRVIAIEATKDHIYVGHKEFDGVKGEHMDYTSPLETYTDIGQAIDGLARKLASLYPEKADAINRAAASKPAIAQQTPANFRPKI